MSTPTPRRKQHVALFPTSLSLSSSSQLFLRLPHPRTRGEGDALLEVQKVAPDADKTRCWFVGDEILSDGSLFLFTPFDPLFLLLALLSGLPHRFEPYSDLWEAVARRSFLSTDSSPGGEDGEGAEDIKRFGALACVRRRVEAVCDVHMYEGELRYCLSPSLVQAALKTKVARLTDDSTGLFGALEKTTLGEVGDAKEETPKPFPTVSRAAGRDGVGDGRGVGEEVQRETRDKAALGILANYLPPSILADLMTSYAFPALEVHLASTTTSSVLSSTYLPGRGSSNGEGAEGGNGFGAAAAKEKKRKADAKGSQGVEALKKVNTKGMKKLDFFFTKKT